MKFKHDNRHKGNEDIIKTHIKTTSQDFKNPSKDSNIYVSKLINQNKNKNVFINESLPNLKNNIQNIFANEDSKEKVFQFLIKKNKDRSSNTSKDYSKKASLKTSDIKSLNKIIKDTQEPKIKNPYNSNNFSLKHSIKTNDFTKSCNDLRPPPYKKKQNYINNNMIYRSSMGSEKYIYEDEPLSQNQIYKKNNYYKNQNNSFANLLTNSNVNFNNRNKSNKYEHIAIYNTYNNTFNNYKIPKSNYQQNIDNQTYNNVQQYIFKNNLNNTNYNIDNNPYKDYLKNTNLSNFKRKLLNNKNIDISDTDNTIKVKDKKYSISKSIPNNDDEIQNLKMNYIKRGKNPRIQVQKNENLNIKNQPTKMNDILTANKSSNSFYVHKNLKYKILNQKRNTKSDIGVNINKNINNTIEYNDNKGNKMKTYEKRKNYYDIYGHKDIRVKTIDDKNNNEKGLAMDNGQSDEPKSTINSIKVNIDKKLIKDYYNSPLSQRYNQYFINNSNKKINSSNDITKKKYEKRETLQRNLNPNFMNIQNDNNSNEQVSDNDKNNINKDKDNVNKDANNSNKKNKYVFNNEEEIIEFIRKKYNKRKVDDILKKEDNVTNNVNANTNVNVNENEIGVNEPKKRKTKKYLGLMTTEEGKKIKQKNEELSNQIKQLKYENKNYKKELNDIKNKYDDLSKEINDIKEKQ